MYEISYNLLYEQEPEEGKWGGGRGGGGGDEASPQRGTLCTLLGYEKV